MEQANAKELIDLLAEARSVYAWFGSGAKRVQVKLVKSSLLRQLREENRRYRAPRMARRFTEQEFIAFYSIGECGDIHLEN